MTIPVGAICTITLVVQGRADNAQPGRGCVFCLPHGRNELFPSTFLGGPDMPLCCPEDWLTDTGVRSEVGPVLICPEEVTALPPRKPRSRVRNGRREPT